MSLLEQNSTRKDRIDKIVKELDFEASNCKKYRVEAIWDSAIYANKLEIGHLQGVHYLIAWKSYLEKENTWELAWAK